MIASTLLVPSPDEDNNSVTGLRVCAKYPRTCGIWARAFGLPFPIPQVFRPHRSLTSSYNQHPPLPPFPNQNCDCQRGWSWIRCSPTEPCLPTRLGRGLRRSWSRRQDSSRSQIRTPLQPFKYSLSRPLPSAVMSSPANLSCTPTTSTVLAGTRQNIQHSRAHRQVPFPVHGFMLLSFIRWSSGPWLSWRKKENTRRYFLFFFEFTLTWRVEN